MTVVRGGDSIDRSAIPVWPGIVVTALVAFVYLNSASGGTFRFGPSMTPHHAILADAWLHGQLYARNQIVDAYAEKYYRRYRDGLERAAEARGEMLTERQWQRERYWRAPPGNHDWSEVNGRRYGYFGPVPTALMVPLVVLYGMNASDTLVGCVAGIGSVFLVFLAARQAQRRGLLRADASMCAALALLFGLGTVQFYLAVLGGVWFMTQSVGTFFLTLAVWAVLHSGGGRGWVVVAGTALSLAVLSRPTMLLTAPFFLLVVIGAGRGAVAMGRMGLLRRMVVFGAPLMVAMGVMLALNYARFGSIFEDGVRIQSQTGAHPYFKQLYALHGAFSWHYVSGNFYYYFLNPSLRWFPGGSFSFDPWGNSMFLVTPALLYLVRAVKHGDRFARALWCGALPVMVLLLFFMGNGWYQFGNRYLLDLMPLAILLVGIGMRGRLTVTSCVLIALSIAVNSWGAYRFRIEQF